MTAGAKGGPRDERPPVLALLCLAALVGAVLLVAYPGRFGHDPIFLSPHESARYHLARQWVRAGAPTVPLAHGARLPEDLAVALVPRDTAVLDGRVVPKDSSYAVVLVALLATIDPRVAAGLGLVSSMGVLVATGLLAHELCGSRRGALLASALAGSAPAFWSASAGLIETGATTAALLLLGLLLLARGWRAARPPVPGKPRGAVRINLAGGAAIGLAAGVHHGSVLLALPVLAVTAAAGPPPALRRAAPALGFLAALLPVLGYNALVNGAPLLSGYGLGERFFDAHFEGHTAGLLDLRWAQLLRNVRLYLLRPEAVAVLLLAAAALRRPGLRAHPALRPLGLAFAAGSFAYLTFMGARPLFGLDVFRVNASFLRYALPVWCVAAVLAAAAAVSARRARRTMLLVAVLACAVPGLVATARGPGGPLQQPGNVHEGARIRAAVLTATERDAIIVTGRSDKYLWPDRTTATVAYLVRSRGDGRVGRHLYDAAPDVTRLAAAVEQFAGTGLPTYVFDDGWLDRLPGSAGLDRVLLGHGVHAEGTGVDGLVRYRTSAR